MYNKGMKRILFRSLAVFFLLLLATVILIDVFKMDFGTVNFWDKHGFFFLLLIAIFPRLTLLFSSVAFGGFLWWLGFFFCPRILVASLATIAYFHTNPVLVILSWLVALGGETFEKWRIGRRDYKFQFQFRPGGIRLSDLDNLDQPTKSNSDHGDIIEAEFTKKP